MRTVSIFRSGVQDNKAIHDPNGRGAATVAQKAGYPKPMVVHPRLGITRWPGTGIQREKP
jgi:deoxyribodipyrimidine photo-lyase